MTSRTWVVAGALTLGLAPPARAAVLWDGDASKGLAVFKIIEDYNGSITVVDDPTYGKVFKLLCNDNGTTKARSEVSWMAGIVLDTKNGDYYVAWRSKWGPLPTKAGKWQVLSQVHHDPDGLGGPVPFGLSVPGDGKMHFNLEDPQGKTTSMWDHPLPLNEWHRFVMHTKMGETLETGSCELWYDGVKQTLTNGKQTIPCAMSRANAGSHWKWGVYRSGAGGPIGQSVHYLQRPMLGTSYEDVAEDGPAAVDAAVASDGPEAIADAGPARDAPVPGADAASVDAGDLPGGGGSGNGGASGGSGGDQGGRGGTPATGEGEGERPPAPARSKAGGCTIGPTGAPAALSLIGTLALALVLRRRSSRSWDG